MKKPKPRAHYWIFVVVAFLARTVGSTYEFRELFNISDDLSKWILAMTASGLPGLDYVFPTARVEPEPEPELDLDSEPAE